MPNPIINSSGQINNNEQIQLINETLANQKEIYATFSRR